MKTTTIKEWVNHFIRKYDSKEMFKIDLDKVISELEDEPMNGGQLAFYKRVRNKYNKMFGN